MWLLGVVVRRYIDFLIPLIPTPLVFVNPRRACAARVTVVVLCVCVCVCLSHRNLKNGCVKLRIEPHFVH